MQSKKARASSLNILVSTVFQPWRTSSERPVECISIFFRCGELSNTIGFRYGHLDPNAAAVKFNSQLKWRFKPTGNNERIVSVILDAENAWGCYWQAGQPFLEAFMACSALILRYAP